jgi:hypothetical protein
MYSSKENNVRKNYRHLLVLSALLVAGSIWAVAASVGKSSIGRGADSRRAGVPSSTLASLGQIRSAIALYYGDSEGLYPQQLTDLVPKYLSSLPACVTVEKGTQLGVQNYSHNVITHGMLTPRLIKGTGKWGYVNNMAVADWGTIFVDIKTYDSVSPRPSKQANLANLVQIRSAVSIYYGDSEGEFPANLNLLVPNYLRSLPAVTTDAAGVKNTVTLFTKRPTIPGELRKTGGWGYVTSTGEVFIDSFEDALYLR